MRAFSRNYVLDTVHGHNIKEMAKEGGWSYKQNNEGLPINTLKTMLDTVIEGATEGQFFKDGGKSWVLLDFTDASTPGFPSHHGRGFNPGMRYRYCPGPITTRWVPCPPQSDIWVPPEQGKIGKEGQHEKGVTYGCDGCPDGATCKSEQYFECCYEFFFGIKPGSGNGVAYHQVDLHQNPDLGKCLCVDNHDRPIVMVDSQATGF